MEKNFTFNWKIFKGSQGGFNFQDMCADIFRHYKYKVRVMEPGGSDEGKDIELYKYSPTNLTTFKEQPFAWVECKSIVTSATPLKLNKININFMYAFKEGITYLIFITNHKFNNEAHNLFSAYNKNPDTFFKIRKIEKEELETILKATPEVYIKYFDKNGKVDDYSASKEELRIDYTVLPNSLFWDDFDGYNINIKSMDFYERKIIVNGIGRKSSEIKLSPLEEKNIFIKSNNLTTLEFPKLLIDNTDEKLKLNSKSKVTTDLNYKIDHIYVDPFNLKKQVIDLLKAHKHIYVSGGGGKGKSRLLKEVTKTLGFKPVLIDLSTNYNKSFLDHILLKILEIEKEYLNILPDTIIANHLKKIEIEEDAIKIFVSYIKGNSSQINYDIIINSTTNLFLRKFQNDIILIDNIHRFSLLDFKFLKSILECNVNNKILCTARDQEITENNLKEHLRNLQENKSICVLDLEQINLSKTIYAFIEEASTDKYSATFLRKYQSVESFQQFIFILKNLKSKGILEQRNKGKILIKQPLSHGLHLSDYLEIYNDLIQFFQAKYPKKPVEKILRIGATFGFRFPVELIESELGEESSTFLDELIINELFVFDEDQMNGSLYVRFDHELTREIICKSIPPIQKNKLHNKVIEYLENIGEASSIFSFGQLAYHYENIQNYKRAAECANKEGHKLIGKSESSEAYKQFEKALLHIKSFSKVSNKDIFELEADSLNQLVRIGSDQIGYTETIYNQIRSLHVLTRLMKNDYYESIVYFYFAKYFFETSYDTNKSSEYIDKAIVCFKNKFPSEYAMSLNLKGVIEKNLGNYNNAIRLHNEAIKIFQEINSWVGLSESYIDLGAVFLESGNGHKTVDLWRKSIDSVKQTLNLTQISNRLVDYSYILALYNSISINVSDELENALFMAKRLRMEPNVCRALINYSNYLFFSESKDLVSIKKHIEEAMKISRENKYDYLLLLSQFSYLTFRNKHKNYFPKDYKKEIVEYLNNSPISEIKGDNRIINIIKFFILKKDKTIINWVRKTSNIKLKEFMKNLSSIPVIKIEKGNPYFHKDSYATYY